jgi:hypothetical protein
MNHIQAGLVEQSREQVGTEWDEVCWRATEASIGSVVFMDEMEFGKPVVLIVVCLSAIAAAGVNWHHQRRDIQRAELDNESLI